MGTVLASQDRLLLALLVPLFGVCFALHAHEVARSGLAQLPVWVYAAPDGGPPIVGGPRLETDSAGSELRPGDRLLRVGDRDLSGVGFIGFDALALEATAAGAAPLVYERGGERHQVSLRPRSRPYPWSRIPGAVLFGLVGALVLLRAADRRDARRFFVAFVVFAIVQSHFYGGPAWKTWTSLLIWNLGAPVSIFLMLRWAALFPDEVGARHRAAWLVPALCVGVWGIHRASYFLGGPVPPSWVAPTGQALNAAFMGATLALLLRNYHMADPIGRRRLKWVLYGCAFGSSPLVLTQLVVFVHPDWADFELAYALSTMLAPTSFLFVLVAVVRYNLFDVDRLLSATASYSVVLAASLAGVLLLLPGLGEWLAARLPVGSGVAQGLLVAGLAATLIPFQRRLAPRIDRVFFPERRAREQGVEQLLRDLRECVTAEEVLELTAERLEGVLRPRHVRVLRTGGSRPGTASGAGVPPALLLPPGGTVARSLERDPRPQHLTAGAPAAYPQASATEHAALHDAVVLLPLRSGKNLSAVVSLGPLRSGDIYTATDRALLAAVTERASAELGRLRDAETIRYERVRADELARLKAAAEEAHRNRSRFLAAASHDLRQPLHVLGLYAGLLREQADRPGAEVLAERIQRSASSLSEMFSALLDVSRLDVGAVEPRIERVDVDGLVADLVGELEGPAREKGLTLRGHKSGLAVRSDPVLLARILRNLLSNAIAYTDRGHVEVGAQRAGPRARIEVHDTGPGIPEERREEIFREFVRLGETHEAPGLGLGLAIAERLARVLGHALELESREGEGSTFRLVADLAETGHRTPPSAIPTGSFEGRLVVVIDDDTAILEASREILRSWGCRALLSNGAADAVQGLELHGVVPDALLVDWHLGGEETGEAAIRRVRDAVGHEVPAAILTGETAPDLLDALRKRGLRVVIKPLTPPRLRALLAELFRGP